MRSGFRILPGERGTALIVALMISLIVAALGSGLAVSSLGALRTTNSVRAQQEAFEAAVAGLERARERVRFQLFGNPVLSLGSLLVTAAGVDGTLVDSASLASFDASAGFSSIDDVPVIGDTALGGSTYRVYLTNDPADGVTNTTDGAVPDGRNVITLTSFARGPNHVGFSAVQAVFRSALPFPIPRFPGLVTLPGPAVSISAPTSNQASLNGDAGDPPCYATFAASTTAARDAIRSAIPSNRRQNYRTCDPTGNGTLDASTVPGSIENFLDETTAANPYNGETANEPRLNPPGDGALAGVLAGCVGDDRDFIRVACMVSFRDAVQLQATYVGNAPAAADLGTPSNPKIAVVNGDLALGPGQYGGILVVKGGLTMHGNTSYTGLVLVVGRGWVRRDGGGNGALCGGMLVVDLLDDGDDAPVLADDADLAIHLVHVDAYAKAMGGSISVESQPGRGPRSACASRSARPQSGLRP